MTASETRGPPDPVAELRVWLAAGEPGRDTGSAVALEAAAQARKCAAALGRPIDEGRAAAWTCMHLMHLGRHAQALAEAPAVLALLVSPELAPERREVLRVLALAGSEVGAFDTALDAAHELVRLTAPLGEDGPALTAAFGLAACFERMGDSWQASRLLTQALENHGGGAPDLPLLIATNGLCAISIGIAHRLADTGESDELQETLQRARVAGERARCLLQRVPHPVYEATVLGNLGEVLLHIGETAAAEPLLRHAHALASRHGLKAHEWRIRASIGNWLAALGRADEALATMQGLIDEMGDAAPQQTAMRCHHVAYRACRALGLFEAGLAHFEIVERLERKRATAQLRAQSRLFVTRTEAQHAQWQAEQARRDAQAQRERAAEFAASAERDPLTGLGNRRHLERRCLELLPLAQHEATPVALAQIDVDHFKAINDQYGHAIGDRVLVTLSQLLRENTRAGDVIVRNGGEEFVIILPGMDLLSAAEVCERLCRRVADYPWGMLGRSGYGVTISIGLAATPPFDAAALLHRADEAMYGAKRAGRNRLALSTG